MAFVLESFSFLLIPWYLYCTAWIGRELFARRITAPQGP